MSGSRLEVALAAGALVAVAAWLPAGDGDGAPAGACALIVLGAALTALVVGGALGDDGATGLAVAGLCGLLVAACWAWLRGRAGAGGRRAPWVALVCVAGVAAVAGSSADERVGGCAYAGLTHGRTGIWTAAVRTARGRPLVGHGLESFLTASRAQQLRERAVPVQYAHDLPLEAWVELGAGGVLIVLALYVATVRATLRAAPPQRRAARPGGPRLPGRRPAGLALAPRRVRRHLGDRRRRPAGVTDPPARGGRPSRMTRPGLLKGPLYS